MSTYIGLKCHDHGVRTACGANHHEEQLLALITAAPLIAQLRASAPVELHATFFWDDSGSYDERPSLFDFLTEHAGHDVRLYDEYGYDYDAAGERIT